MYSNQELCTRIKDVHPDIGECGIDIDVDYDEEKKAWVVDLKRGEKELKTYMEAEDADKCMDGKQCVGLGLQIAQLKDHIQQL